MWKWSAEAKEEKKNDSYFLKICKYVSICINGCICVKNTFWSCICIGNRSKHVVLDLASSGIGRKIMMIIITNTTQQQKKKRVVLEKDKLK